MKVAVKKQYIELVDTIDFPSIVYIYETGRIIAVNEQATKFIGSSCKNINCIWEEGRLKIAREILDNGSEIYLNKKIMDGRDRKVVDIEINCYELDQQHIVFCFMEQSYKCFFTKYLFLQVPRIFWKNVKRHFIGCNRFLKNDFDYEKKGKEIMNADVIGEENVEEIDRIEIEIIKNKQCQYSAIEQLYKKEEGYYFCKMSRMPILNKMGTVEGMLGVYTLILNREEYQELFNKSLNESNILSEVISRSNLIVISYELGNHMLIQHVTSNFEMLGYKVDEIYIKKKGWIDFIYEEDYDLIKNKSFEQKEEEKKYREYRVRKADGTPIWIEEECVDIINKTDETYYVSIIRVLEKEYDKEVGKDNAVSVHNKAMIDFLTGLPNRHKFELDAPAFIERAVRYGNQGYVIVFDLDDFKHINEGLSPEYGDILLKKIADSIDEIAEVQNYCYRIDGDEFLLLLDGTYEKKLEDILEQLMTLFNQPWELNGKECYCTMSMGIVSYPYYATEPRELLKYADSAVYEAKSKGKNRVCYYKERSIEKSANRLNYEKYLRKAITKGCVEFVLYYQPIVRSKDKKVVAAEALLRWKSPELGFVTPMKFISLSEYLGLIVPLGEYVLRQAFIACKEWNEKIEDEISISVNLSVVQLVQPNIVEHIVKIAEETGVKKEKIILEVTESLAVEDMELMKTVLIELKKEGFHIALDDFGTGYSSLNHIMEMPLDYIKIDKSFINSYGTGSFNPSLLSAIAELAHSMNMKIVVEGVETRQQMEFLMFLNTDRYQGYLYGKPVPEDVFLENYILAPE